MFFPLCSRDTPNRVTSLSLVRTFVSFLRLKRSFFFVLRFPQIFFFSRITHPLTFYSDPPDPSFLGPPLSKYFPFPIPCLVLPNPNYWFFSPLSEIYCETHPSSCRFTSLFPSLILTRAWRNSLFFLPESFLLFSLCSFTLTPLSSNPGHVPHPLLSPSLLSRSLRYLSETSLFVWSFFFFGGPHGLL